jgi:hypothetical protein
MFPWNKTYRWLISLAIQYGSEHFKEEVTLKILRYVQ